MLVTQWIMPFWVDVYGQEAALVVVPSETNTVTNSYQYSCSQFVVHILVSS